MSFQNPLLASWQAGNRTYGLWAAVPSPVSAEMLAFTGPDYVCVDMQHGAIGFDTAVTMLQAIWSHRVPPLVRVPANDAGLIMRVLDAGALGIVVPMVSTAQQAADAVAACRYPPAGSRSFGPVRAAMVTGSRQPADLDQVACIAMVETLEGLHNLDRIVATEGLTGVYVGPADLSLVFGLPPAYEQEDPRHQQAVRDIQAACAGAGIVPGVHCVSEDNAVRRRDEGFQMITVGNDGAMLQNASKSVLSAVRDQPASGKTVMRR